MMATQMFRVCLLFGASVLILASETQPDEIESTTIIIESTTMSPNGGEESNINAVSAAPADAGSSEPTAATSNWVHLNFEDDWSTKYSRCSLQNQYGSPVNINTWTAVATPKSLRTLMLYSFDPITYYYLQTWYNDTENNISMSALTITLDDSIFFEATYINGMGYDAFQLFQRAVFFFSKQNLTQGRSHHRINSTRYPMEIMLTFSDRVSFGHEEMRETTQIFILVEIQPYDNPNFFPVIDAAKKILKMKSKSDRLKLLTAELDHMTKNLTNLTQVYEQSGEGGAVETLEPLIPEVKRAVEKLKSNVPYRAALAALINFTTKELELGNYEAAYITIKEELNNIKKNFSGAKEKLKGNHKNAELRDTKEALERGLTSTRGRITALQEVLGRAFFSLATYRRDYNRSIEVDQVLNARIDAIAGAISTSANLSDGTKILEFYREQVKLQEQIEDLQKRVNITVAELKTTQTAPGWRQQLDLFQITWLFPDGGGVYIYNGSSPLPPCYRFRSSIVLQVPIGISQEQFDILAAIPAYEGYTTISQDVAGHLSDLGQRPVWFNKKHIQWQRDDGVHMKSIFRRQYRKQLSRRSAASAMKLWTVRDSIHHRGGSRTFRMIFDILFNCVLVMSQLIILDAMCLSDWTDLYSLVFDSELMVEGRRRRWFPQTTDW